MSEISDHIEPFRTILGAMANLRGDAPSLNAARDALADSLNFWIDEVKTSGHARHILNLAVQEFDDDQLQCAIRARGNPVYARILRAMDNNYAGLRLSGLRLRRLSNDDIDALIAGGFDYEGARHHKPEAEWMVRGAAYAKHKFRAKHPRKNPVVAYWEERGLSLPPEGLCYEGAKMVADLLRNNDQLPKRVRDAAERSAQSTDWRVALCMRIEGHSYPYTISRVLNHIYGAPERRDAINKCLAPATSNHERLAREGRMARMPSLEEILMSPSDKDSLDPILEKVGCAPMVSA
jgi:hypothetical protein